MTSTKQLNNGLKTLVADRLINPAKFYHPFWCTAPLQYVYKWSTIQAMTYWVTTNIV